MDIRNFPTSVPVIDLEPYFLRGVETRDDEALFLFLSDKEVTQFTSLQAETISQVQNWITEMLKRFDARQSIYWVIVDAESEVVIGRCHYISFNLEHSCAEIGYYLSKDYWGRGIATLAVGAVVAYGFGRLGLRRIEATADSQNFASARVLEKNGFIKKRKHREHTVRNGHFKDVDVFSLRKEDFLREQ